MTRRACLGLVAAAWGNEHGGASLLRLRHPADRDAFRRWFVALAEFAYFSGEQCPAEISDCSALLRFCFRESLRRHDGAWARAWGIESFPPAPDVRQYLYPRTPLGPNVFRTQDGTFRQFADAGNLMRHNTVRVSGDLVPAEPGDLLFYRQLTPAEPFHSMIWVGKSPFESSADLFVVYHTGPLGGERGEVRRLSSGELMRHKDPRWQPVRGNANFLGLFRWSILV